MKLKLNVKRFNNEDVIATSTYKLTGLKDGVSGNIQFSGPTPEAGTLFHESAGGRTWNWTSLQLAEESGSNAGDFNGEYTWNETKQYYEQENKK